MSTPVGGSTRFAVARTAVNTLVSGSGDKLRYGLELFGLNAPVADGCNVSDQTCSYPTPMSCKSVSCQFNSAPSISSVLADAGPEGATPTAQAVRAAALRPDMTDATRSRFILLVTDGDPTCPTTPAGVALSNTVQSISDVRDGGVRTFVLGFGGGSAGNLAQMAIAGGVTKAGCDAGTPQSCYYVATNAAELQTALNAIQSVVSSELGGTGGCDETCYSQGCPSGQVCKKSACVADPCSGVMCGANEACVNGVCNKFCTTACAVGKYCNSAGACVDEVPCSGITPPCDEQRNQVCVNGMCVEDHCSGASATIKDKCPAGTFCIRNNCSPEPIIILPDGGMTLADGGPVGGGKTPTPGCCSGAPEAFSALTLAIGLSALAARYRRRRP
jgi:hypothetical protein